MRRLVFILTLACCLTAFGQAFTPRRPFIFASAGAGVPFSPTNIAGMAYWWNADDLTNLVNQQVNSWTDRVQQVVFTNASATPRPLYTNYGLYFGGSQYLTNRPGFSIIANSSVFVALSRQANANTRYKYLTWSQDSAAGQQDYSVNGDSYVFVPTKWTCWRLGDGTRDDLCSGLLPVNSLLTLCTVRGLGAFTNAIAADPVSWPVDKFDTFGGNSPPFVTVEGFVGPMYEIIIYTNLITSTDVSNLHQYAQTWDIKGTILYFTTQPTNFSCDAYSVVSIPVALSTTNASLQWQTNSVNLANGNMWAGVTNTTLWITNSSILFSNLSITCIATNQYYSVTSSVALMNVRDYTNGLVVRWKFDDASGTSAADASGYANTGTLFGTPIWTNGVYGGALLFNGTNQWVVKSNATLVPIADTDRTYSAWVNPTKMYDGYAGYVFTTGFPNANTSWLLGYRNSSAQTGWQLTTAGAANDLKSTTTYNYNTWWLYTCTYSAGMETIYINGSFVTNKNITSTATSDSNTYVGKHASGEYWKGFVDEARVWARLLSTNEIGLLYQWKQGQ